MINLIIASGFRLAFGTASFGIGGVNYTLVNDWSAVFWNPSLLSDQRNSFSIDLFNFYGLSTYQMTTNIMGYDGVYPRLKDNKAYNQRGLTTIPSIGFTRYSDAFTWAFGVFVPFGMGTSWDLYDPPINYYNSYDTTWQKPKYPERDWESDVKTFAFWFGLGREFGMFRWGLAGGPVIGKIYMRKVTLQDPAEIDPAAADLPIEYRLWPIDTRIWGTGYAFGGSAGITALIGEMFRFAITGRFYTPMQIDGKATLQLFSPRNDYIAENAPDAAMLVSGYVFKGEGIGKTSLPLPPDMGIGFSFRPTRAFALNFGFNYVFWKVLDKVVLNFDDMILLYNQISSDTLEFHWKNTYEFGIGTEVSLGDRFTFRLGFAYDQSPIPDSTFNPLMPDLGKRLGFSGGFGLALGDYWTLNLAYTYTMAPDREIKAKDNYSYKSPYMPGKYTFNAHIVNIGLIYRW
ncbi:MAG: outer membrane protein transport protein [candidate division WOR-3 bacterium]